MYGMENKPKGHKFMFDLEVELEKNPHRRKELLEKAETHAHELKTALREGSNKQDLDKMGILLHGYTALQKVLKKTHTKRN
jgi:hypothetical protein